MHITACSVLLSTLISASYCAAESRQYQTSPAQAQQQQHRHPLEIPLIEIDPDTGEKKIYLNPQGLNADEYQISANYNLQSEDTSSGLHQAIQELHQRMIRACPNGWIKTSEWGIPIQHQISLNYAFICLNPQP